MKGKKIWQVLSLEAEGGKKREGKKEKEKLVLPNYISLFLIYYSSYFKSSFSVHKLHVASQFA